MAVKCVMKGVCLLWCSLILLAEASPTRKVIYTGQVCGDHLADLMSLVCFGRGYNGGFLPETSNARRVRRGIVEECCRSSCTPTMLELYCKADTKEDASNVPIRKRSESVESTEMQEMEITQKKTTTEKRNILVQESKTETTTMKEGEENYSLLNLLAPPQKLNTRTSTTNLTPNDTAEEEATYSYRQSKYPPMRHKSHHHSMRQFHNRKVSSKTKRAKDEGGESSQTFQIGMVKPYFAGKALASYSSNYVHHAALS